MITSQPLVTLSMTGSSHELLKAHLLVGDGLEAAAILLCGRRSGEHRHRLVVQEIHPIPYDQCSERSPYRLTWSTEVLVPLLERAEELHLSVIKIHSHPGGYAAFSEIDDIGDKQLLPMIREWVEEDIPHGSAIMLPDGSIFGRILWAHDVWAPISSVAVVGADLQFWRVSERSPEATSFSASHAQAFGAGTTEQLRHLTVGVIGCSGTGSPVIEQLVRLGVGELVLTDPDHVEERNLNRILNSTVMDAVRERPKVKVLEEAIHRIGLGTRVRAFQDDLWNRDIVRAIADCDVVFGCMDTVSGRFLLNQIATYYIIPYFDLGVRLEAISSGSDEGRIREVCGTVHYLQPGKSTLMSRGLFSIEQVVSERMQLTSPEQFNQQVADGYIRGVVEHRPAVISVNMFIAALAVSDFLARLHPYRDFHNSRVASIEFSLSSLELFPEPESATDTNLTNKVGVGDVEPLLGIMELAEIRI